MKSYLIFGFMIFNSFAIHGSNDAQKKFHQAREEHFIETVVEFLQPKQGIAMADEVKKVKDSIQTDLRNVDFDTLMMSKDYLSSPKDRNFFLFLSMAAFDQSRLLKTDHSSIRAKIVLALLHPRYSREGLRPFDLLRSLIDTACVASMDSKSEDAIGEFEKKHYDNLELYLLFGLGKVINPAVILFNLDGTSQSMDGYLQGARQKGYKIDRIYRLVEKCNKTLEESSQAGAAHPFAVVEASDDDSHEAITQPSENLGASSAPNELRASLIQIIAEAVQADEKKFDVYFTALRAFFREKGQIDVDEVYFNKMQSTETESKTLGEYLNKVAFKEISLIDNSEVARSNAQIILAFVYQARSNKAKGTSPLEILFELINAAKKPHMQKKEAAEAERFLTRYFNAGSSAGPFNLSKIRLSNPKDESLEDYFERESKNNETIGRIYRLLTSLQEADTTARDSVSSQKTSSKVDKSGTPHMHKTGATATAQGSSGTKPKGKGATTQSVDMQQGNVGSADTQSTNQKKGWSSYFTPRNVLFAAGACCVAVLIYKRHGLQVQQKDEKNSTVIA